MIIDWFDAAAGAVEADIVRTSVLIRPSGSPASAPEHLPGADYETMRIVHAAYLEAMFDSPATERIEAERWEPVIAASRLAEGAQTGESELLAIWHGRATGRERAEP
ncbi:MAG: hypothetical protein HKN26_04755 [Acidimicrobiales bacterium]|nr:hypothetical protein [Acidimicrobiales bacterium]